MRDRDFFVTGAIVLVCLAVVYVSPAPAMLDSTIDASWEASLTAQFLARAQCGVDLVFTYGPWGFLAEPRGDPAIYPWLLFGRFVLALGIAAGAAGGALSCLKRGAVRWLWLALFVLLANPIILNLFLLYAVFFEMEPGPRRSWCLAALVPACALSAHIKLVALPLAATLGALVAWHDLADRRHRLFHHRVPWTGIGLAVCYAGFYFAAGQRVSSFLPYLRGAAYTMSGYGTAMSAEGSWWVAAAGAGLCLLMPLVYGMGAMRRGRAMAPGAFWVAAYFFMAFKQGLVRQDGGHLLAGMLTFAIPSSLVLLLFLPAAGVWRRWVLAPFLAAELLVFTSATAAAGDLGTFLGAKWAAIHDLPKAFEGVDARRRAYERDRAAWKAAVLLPAMKGGVDILPTDIFVLLANQAPYRPRPVPQSYAAVNPQLARLNADFYSGAGAPEYAVMSADALDGRLPSTEDNLAWMTLLTRYRPDAFAGSYLVLRKAEEPQAPRREKIFERTLGWGETLQVPQGADAVWAEIDVPASPLGRLADFFFRPPEVDIALEAGGARAWYRLVTPLARTGFLLSPVVENPMQFALLYQGGEAPLSPKVSRLSVESNGAWGYGQAIVVRLYGLTIANRMAVPLAGEGVMSLAESIHSTTEGASWEERPSWRVRGGRAAVQASAPSVASIDWDGPAAGLRVGFGLANECDDVAEPHARVEFRVSYRSSDGGVDTMLLRQVLEARGSDEVRKNEEVAAPKGTGRLTFATSFLGGNCRVGAYWSGVERR